MRRRRGTCPPRRRSRRGCRWARRRSRGRAHLGVDLDAVAGGHGEGAADVRGLRHVADQLAERGTAHDRPLQDRERGALVAQSDHENAHRTAAWASCGTRTTDLRCAWKARICNSMDRSTLRTSTPPGTLRTTGAKLRMLVTPVATSRSQTACAVPAGVAMTPMDTRCRATTCSI